MDIEDLQQYVKDSNIEDLVLELTESLLRDRPPDPKRYLWERLSEDDSMPEWGRHLGAGSKSIVGNAIMDVPGQHLVRLFESTRCITAEIVPKETINIIIKETIKLLNCDRVSLFVIDKKTNWLILFASNLTKQIRVQPGQGIAGHVFKTQESVNITNCYEDSRFDPSFDKATGYHTKTMLVMPIIDFEGESVGALQAINKVDNGEFNQVDELLMGHLTQHAGIALRNSEVYRDAITANERANGLLNMIQSLSQDLGTQSTILTITMHANGLVQADRCTVFLVDESKGQLWSVSTDSGKEIRIPRTAGIAGEACQERRIINIPDAYQDPRFNQAIDKRTGYHTQSILAVPVVDDHQRSLAVIQMINKKDGEDEIGQFTDDDVRTMETFAKLVASKLATSTLVKASGIPVKTEGQAAFTTEVPPPMKDSQRRTGTGHIDDNAIMEMENESEGQSDT